MYKLGVLWLILLKSFLNFLNTITTPFLLTDQLASGKGHFGNLNLNWKNHDQKLGDRELTQN